MSARDIWALALEDQPSDTNATSFLFTNERQRCLSSSIPAAGHLAHL